MILRVRILKMKSFLEKYFEEVVGVIILICMIIWLVTNK